VRTQRSSFIGLFTIWLCFISLWLGWVSGDAWAQSADVCGPAPGVKAALDQLPQQTPAQTDWQFREQHAAALQAVLRQYPEDVSVNRVYINSMGSRSDKDKVIAQYKARYERNPDNPQAAYLYGLALEGRQSPEAVKLFSAALKEDSKFPWPHLQLVTIFNSPVFLNKEQRDAHLRAFLDACPASLDGYQPLTRMDDKDLLRPYAAQLRTQLESRSDPDAVGAYRTLWAIEFKLHPASNYDALRRQVGQDVERLRQLKLEDKRQWYDAFESGYKLVNDQKQSDWAVEQHLIRFPSVEGTAAMWRWWIDRHWPGDATPPDEKRAFYLDLLQQSVQWAKDRPNTLSVWVDRLWAMERLEDAAAADVKVAADQVLKVAINNAGPDGPESYIYSEVAEVLSKKHLEPDRVVQLAQKGLAQWEIESKDSVNDLYATKEGLDYHKYYPAFSRLQILEFEVNGYLQLKQADKAQLLLARMDEWLQDLKLLAGDNPRHRKSYAGTLSAYWEQMAREAELRGHKLDAMGFYENALLTRLDAQQKPETGKKDELADNAHRLWSSLGGTDEGWSLWYGRRADALASQAGLTWEDSNLPLPAFELADLSGKTWNVASLKGKVTFVNFWATWCGPCREELPRLQRLADQYKNRSDVQFISFNLDENPGLVAPFLKEHQLAFIVIPAYSYVWETLKVSAIPANWILDPGGVIRLKGLGYDATEKWVTSVKEAVEKVQTTAPPANAPAK
jgi:thiol-disulfide isomerase/thioredoxin